MRRSRFLQLGLFESFWDMAPLRRAGRALVSVWDKSGLAEFAYGLRQYGIDIVSTGGTADFLRQAGIEIVPYSAYTGFVELIRGRVKTPSNIQ